MIVASNAIPQTDPYLIDRMTAIAALKGCEVLICINKSDLDHADELCAIYEKARLPFLLTSACSRVISGAFFEVKTTFRSLSAMPAETSAT